jgi:hypothetical protein
VSGGRRAERAQNTRIKIDRSWDHQKVSFTHFDFLFLKNFYSSFRAKREISRAPVEISRFARNDARELARLELRGKRDRDWRAAFEKFAARDFHFDSVVLAHVRRKAAFRAEWSKTARAKTILRANVFVESEKINAFEHRRRENVAQQCPHCIASVMLAPLRRLSDDDAEFAVALFAIHRENADASDQFIRARQNKKRATIDRRMPTLAAQVIAKFVEREFGRDAAAPMQHRVIAAPAKNAFGFRIAHWIFEWPQADCIAPNDCHSFMVE